MMLFFCVLVLSKKPDRQSSKMILFLLSIRTRVEVYQAPWGVQSGSATIVAMKFDKLSILTILSLFSSLS